MAFDFRKLTDTLKNSFTQNSERKIVGIDIGASAIKVVQLHDKDGIPMLDTYGELQLGPYDNLDIGQIARLKESRLTEALVDIVRESSVTADTVALSISYASSFTTTLSIDHIAESELANRVPVEARKYVPVPLDEVTLDWFPLAQDETAGRTTLLLVAIYNEALKRIHGAVAGAGLMTAFNELEPFSAIRSAVSQSDTAVAVIDWGAGATKLYIIQNGVLRGTHSLKPNGVELTRLLKDTLSVTFPEAEELKRRNGLSDVEGYQQGAQALRDSLARGIREADRMIDRYEQDSGTQIERILFTGGGASLAGLPSFMQDLISRPVVLSQPFAKIAYQVFLEDTLKEIGPSFSVAIGAALRSFNEGR